MDPCCHHPDGEKQTPAVAVGGARQSSRMPLILWGAAAVVAVAWLYLFGLPRQEATAPAAAGAAADVTSAVLPAGGITVAIDWGDTGTRLVETGAIDMEKYRQYYGDGQSRELLSYLTDTQGTGITINEDNAQFWVNTLWALGLVQKSQVLDEGVMGTDYRAELGNFASTGGWTLGAKPAVDLYSSAELVPLTAQQQQLVQKISEGVYRPCCGNSTAFPDCNHGMAALGLIELMVSQGAAEDDIYRALLAFNSYWFTQTYLDLAYYFQTYENTAWADVDPRRVLSAEFSSAQGYQKIKQRIGTIPGTEGQGSSCSA